MELDKGLAGQAFQTHYFLPCQSVNGAAARSRARPCKRFLLQIPPGGLAAVFSRSPGLAVRRRRRRAAGRESFHRAAVGRQEISADTTAQGRAKTDWRQCRKILCPNCRSPRVRRAARSAQLPLHDSGICSASCKKALPATVSCTVRFVRSSNLTPSSSSRSRMVWLIAGCATCRRRDASL